MIKRDEITVVTNAFVFSTVGKLPEKADFEDLVILRKTLFKIL